MKWDAESFGCSGARRACVAQVVLRPDVPGPPRSGARYLRPRSHASGVKPQRVVCGAGPDWVRKTGSRPTPHSPGNALKPASEAGLSCATKRGHLVAPVAVVQAAIGENLGELGLPIPSSSIGSTLPRLLCGGQSGARLATGCIDRNVGSHPRPGPHRQRCGHPHPQQHDHHGPHPAARPVAARVHPGLRLVARIGQHLRRQ